MSIRLWDSIGPAHVELCGVFTASAAAWASGVSVAVDEIMPSATDVCSVILEVSGKPDQLFKICS